METAIHVTTALFLFVLSNVWGTSRGLDLIVKAALAGLAIAQVAMAWTDIVVWVHQ